MIVSEIDQRFQVEKIFIQPRQLSVVSAITLCFGEIVGQCHHIDRGHISYEIEQWSQSVGETKPRFISPKREQK